MTMFVTLKLIGFNNIRMHMGIFGGISQQSAIWWIRSWESGTSLYRGWRHKNKVYRLPRLCLFSYPSHVSSQFLFWPNPFRGWPFNSWGCGWVILKKKISCKRFSEEKNCMQHKCNRKLMGKKGKKYPAHQIARKKNSWWPEIPPPPPTSRVKWLAPQAKEAMAQGYCCCRSFLCQSHYYTAFTYIQNPLEWWRRYQTNFIREH